MWKSIPNYEGLYEISDCGEVMSLNYRKKNIRHPLSIFSNRKGYRMVNLAKEGNTKSYRINRLMAAAFLGMDLNSDLTVDHKDEDKSNDTLSNLQILSRGDNMRKSSLGSKSKRAKIDEDIAKAIKQDINLGLRLKDIAENRDVSYTTVVDIKRGRTWSHVLLDS